MEHKKYTLSYCSGATGFGWDEEYDTLNEFEYFVDDTRKEFTAQVKVFDRSIKKFIYWKDCLSYDPYIDMLHDSDRDMRTTTRKRK